MTNSVGMPHAVGSPHTCGVEHSAHLPNRGPVEDAVDAPLQAAGRLPDALPERSKWALHRLLQLAGLSLRLLTITL